MKKKVNNVLGWQGIEGNTTLLFEREVGQENISMENISLRLNLVCIQLSTDWDHFFDRWYAYAGMPRGQIPPPPSYPRPQYIHPTTAMPGVDSCPVVGGVRQIPHGGGGGALEKKQAKILKEKASLGRWILRTGGPGWRGVWLKWTILTSQFYNIHTKYFF